MAADGRRFTRIRLRRHGLIKKASHCYKYYLTALAEQVITLGLKLKELVIIPTLAATDKFSPFRQEPNYAGTDGRGSVRCQNSSFATSWIWREVVMVELIEPEAADPSVMLGSAKLARFRILKPSPRSCSRMRSVIGMFL